MNQKKLNATKETDCSEKWALCSEVIWSVIANSVNLYVAQVSEYWTQDNFFFEKSDASHVDSWALSVVQYLKGWDAGDNIRLPKTGPLLFPNVWIPYHWPSSAWTGGWWEGVDAETESFQQSRGNWTTSFCSEPLFCARYTGMQRWTKLLLSHPEAHTTEWETRS